MDWGTMLWWDCGKTRAGVGHDVGRSGARRGGNCGTTRGGVWHDAGGVWHHAGRSVALCWPPLRVTMQARALMTCTRVPRACFVHKSDASPQPPAPPTLGVGELPLVGRPACSAMMEARHGAASRLAVVALAYAGHNWRDSSLLAASMVERSGEGRVKSGMHDVSRSRSRRIWLCIAPPCFMCG